MGDDPRVERIIRYGGTISAFWPVRARGSHLYDASGRTVLDFHLRAAQLDPRALAS